MTSYDLFEKIINQPNPIKSNILESIFWKSQIENEKHNFSLNESFYEFEEKPKADFFFFENQTDSFSHKNPNCSTEDYGEHYQIHNTLENLEQFLGNDFITARKSDFEFQSRQAVEELKELSIPKNSNWLFAYSPRITQAKEPFLVNKPQTNGTLLGKKRKKADKSTQASEKSPKSPKVKDENKKAQKPKPKPDTAKSTKKPVAIKNKKTQKQKKVYFQGDYFPKLNEGLLARINLKCFLKIIKLEKIISKRKKVTTRMKQPDSIDKKINIVIRRFITCLIEYLIDYNINLKRNEKFNIKKKLNLSDFSLSVSIANLKALHDKSLAEIFIAEKFITIAKIRKGKLETLDDFKIRKLETENKRNEKFIYAEKKLKEIVKIPLFQEIANIRINEIYKQITETEIIKKELSLLEKTYENKEYLSLVEKRISERLDTFSLFGNKKHKDKKENVQIDHNSC